MKSIFFIFLFLFFISFTSAIDIIYSGEPYSFDIEQSYDYYSIVGNSSEVNFELIQNGTIITIIPDKYSINDTFTMVFFNEKEIIKEVQISGNGGRSYCGPTKYKNNTIYLTNETKCKDILGLDEIKDINDKIDNWFVRFINWFLDKIQFWK